MSKSTIRPLLDRIEKPIASFLKNQGFSKKGRTFNRETEKGVIQVVNLQSGSYPIGNYVVPGVRQSFYGRFAVNLGVGIDEIWRIRYPNNALGAVWQDCNCAIRTRLGVLLYSKDHWWEIPDDAEAISKEIIDGLVDRALPWFLLFDNREKICANYSSDMAPSANLDRALIIFYKDRDKGIRLLQDYFDGPHLNSFHKEYVLKLAELIGVRLDVSDLQI